MGKLSYFIKVASKIFLLKVPSCKLSKASKSAKEKSFFFIASFSYPKY